MIFKEISLLFKDACEQEYITFLIMHRDDSDTFTITAMYHVKLTLLHQYKSRILSHTPP